MSTTTTTYAESVASCSDPSHLQSPPPPEKKAAAAAALPRAAVKRQLNFAAGVLDDDESDFLFRAAEEAERSHHESSRRAFSPPPLPPPPMTPPTPPAFLERQCICWRGNCTVEQSKCGRWAYVCPSTPRCTYFAWCKEADLGPNPQHAFMNHYKPNNHHILNSPCNPDLLISPDNHLAAAPNSQPPLRAHPRQSYPHVFKGPSNPSASNIPSNPPASNIPSNPHASNSPSNPHVSNSPSNPHVSNSPSNNRAGATPLNVSPQDAKSNGKRPICLCRAGECKEKTIKGQKYYVCHIQKGDGACPYRVPVNAFVKESPQTGYNNPVEDNHVEYSPVNVDGNDENGSNNPDQPEYDEWPFDIVDNDVVPSRFLLTSSRDGVLVAESLTPSTQHQKYDIIELKTPTKPPVPPLHGSGSPFAPGSKSNCCFRCGEDGHWSKNCLKLAFSPLNSPCFVCGKHGHWKDNCPELRDTRGV